MVLADLLLVKMSTLASFFVPTSVWLLDLSTRPESKRQQHNSGARARYSPALGKDNRSLFA